MNSSELLVFAQEFFNKNIEIMKKKNADYTAQSSFAFANFTALEQISGIQGATEIGFLNRMQDKFMRISSFVKNGELKVKDEAVEDTLSDLANYSMLFAGYLHWKAGKEKEVVND